MSDVKGSVRLVSNPVRDDEHALVVCFDEPGAGGASHRYGIVGMPDTDNAEEVFANVKFQEGPVHESCWNGCQNEDLLLIVRDRLQSFQAGDFSCRENALALTAIEQALQWLHQRTFDPEKRKVEGTSKQ